MAPAAEAPLPSFPSFTEVGEDGETFALGGAGGAGGDAAAAEDGSSSTFTSGGAARSPRAARSELEASVAEAISAAILSFDDRGMVTLSRKVPSLRTASADAAAAIVRCARGTALVVSGFCIKKAMAAETDGPPGAVAVGEALARLGFAVAYVTDRFSSDVMRATAAGGATAACEVVEFPVSPGVADVPYADDAAARAFAARLLADKAPTLLVAVERAGRGRDGRYRNIRGEAFDELNARVDYLFDLKPAAALSVGVVDGGNEIGCGALAASGALPVVDAAGRTLTSTPAATRTDHVVAASVSNWGAYGLCAALAALARDPALLPTPERGEALLAAGVAAGAVDGLRHACEMYVDGRPGADAPLESLGRIVRASLPAAPKAASPAAPDPSRLRAGHHVSFFEPYLAMLRPSGSGAVDLGSFDPRCCAEIDVGALISNARAVQAAATAQGHRGVIAVVKADAYGHGAPYVARTLHAFCGIDFFAVASLPEALELRASGPSGMKLRPSLRRRSSCARRGSRRPCASSCSARRSRPSGRCSRCTTSRR